MVATPLVIPGCFLVAITGTCNGKTIENVIGVEKGTATAPTPDEIASAVGNAWQAAGGPLQQAAAGYIFTAVKVTDLSSATGPVAEHSYSVHGGQPGQDLATMASCALISWHGGSRSRSANGRMYFGPLQENNIAGDGRTLTGSYQTALNSAFGQFRDDIITAEYQWVTLSRKHLVFAPVVNPIAQGVIATQRRRLR